MLWDAQTFHALPEPGGLRDQPAGLLKRIRTAGHVYNSLRAYRQYGLIPGEGAKWKALNPGIMKVVSYIRKLRSGESIKA